MNLIVCGQTAFASAPRPLNCLHQNKELILEINYWRFSRETYCRKMESL